MSLPTTQNALVLPVKYGEWVLRRDFPVPSPGPKDVLVKIIATALNPVDWKVQRLGYVVESFPLVGGTDCSGIVEEVGSDVRTVAKGDRVLYQGYFENPKATFQQYGIVPAEIVAKIPDHISFEQAASVPLALDTAVIGMYNHNPQAQSLGFTAPWEEGGSTAFAGQPALIIGGASSVGQYAIQMAKLSGFSPVITTASLHNAALLKALGATHIVDRKLPPETIAEEVAKLAEGKPIEFVFDTISLSDTQQLGYDVLAPGGGLLLVLPESIPAERKKAGDNKKVVFVFGTAHVPENRQVGVELYRRLTEYLEKGLVVPNQIEVLPDGLSGIPDGLERLRANKVSGRKLIACPQETKAAA
ncbi:GroES-like protein [Trametes maxima]|nr:GroES-like protein [Trametes maxima]